MRRLAPPCALGAALTLALAGCPSGAPSETPSTARAGRLAVAPGLEAVDFEAFGADTDEATEVGSEGDFVLAAPLDAPGVVFAVPRAGSPTAGRLADGTGLYLSPTPGEGLRLVRGGALGLATSGPVALDATTTVLGLLLLHPDLAHPQGDVQRAQLEWMLGRLGGGWPALAAAAARYDALLAEGRAFDEDADFASAWTEALEDVRRDMPTPSPARIRTDRAGLLVRGDDYALSSGGREVSTLTVRAADASALELVVGTENGTGLDYLYQVRVADGLDTTGGLDAPDFLAPSPERSDGSGPVLASGHVASSSYWRYADVLGRTVDYASQLVTSGTGIAPSATLRLARPPRGVSFYELRLFSGGWGVGRQAALTELARQRYPAEAGAAFRLNLAAALLETMSLIPGSEALLGDDAVAAAVQSASLAALTRIQAVLEVKGPGGLEASDVYAIVYDVAGSVVQSAVAESTKGAQRQGARRVIRWFGSGGKRALRFLFGVPGRVARGGALANRSFRLLVPDSVMEVWLIGLEAADGPGCALGCHRDTDRIEYGCVPVRGAFCRDLAASPAEKHAACAEAGYADWANFGDTGETLAECAVRCASEAERLGAEFARCVTPP